MAFMDFAIIHHANQYLITNGYTNREGLDEVLGIHKRGTGYLKIFQLHQAYKIPFNLHLSGTLLETILWHHPDFLFHLKELKSKGLLDFIGSCYGQNIMRFFGDQHNLKQLNEQLGLYQQHLDILRHHLKVLWLPERVWDTERLAKVVSDKKLSNQGYKYILIDDRLFHPVKDGAGSREAFDHAEEQSLTDFYPCHISQGDGLIALPISVFLRHHIPPHNESGLKKVEKFFRRLAEENSNAECTPIAIYGDDLEKTAGCCGWTDGGPAGYEAFLEWLSRNPWIRPVKLNEWAAHCDGYQKPIGVGTYYEMSQHFGAGEDYEKWYYDSNWDKYRSYYAWSEGKVSDYSDKGADASLLELAWKHLLASSWETAWHVPPYGTHGNPATAQEPSPWARAIASHSRHAAVIAEAAYWMMHKDGTSHAYSEDIDQDGEHELILKNDQLFAVFSPRWGGRLIFLFSISGGQGKLVVGNPSDDWNWMEELNRYMEIPANHPGALADDGYENNRYEVALIEDSDDEAKAVLINEEDDSPAIGMMKSLVLTRARSEIEVTYQLPRMLTNLSLECGLSPDYLQLLRSGRGGLKEFRSLGARGYSNQEVMVWVRLKDLKNTFFDESAPREFGHGYAIRIQAWVNPFTIWIGSKWERGQG